MDRSFILLFLCLSCTNTCANKERYISATKMWEMAQDTGEKVELVFVPMTAPEKRVMCHHYNMLGCVPGSGKRIKVRMVEFLTIQFETESQARDAAFRYDQYHAGNWLFDEVTNEPVIEHFLKKYFSAVNPRRINR